MRAMLVAAGFGTRLDPLTRELPKPAVPVANRPVAWFAADQLARFGADELVINTHHLGDPLRAALQSHVRGPKLTFVHEPRILGTGGGVRNAWGPSRDEDFIVFNAKLVFAPDLQRALAAHRERGAIATMILRALPDGGRFAPVLIDGDDRIRSIRAASAPGDGLLPRMWTGVQILHPRAFADLPADGDMIEGAYLPWLARGEVIASVTDDSPWLDVGVSLRHYLDANLSFARGEVAWPGLAEPAPNAAIIAPDARIERGAVLEQAVIGAGASVAAGVRLTRVVLWPGARAEADLQDAVVTSAGVIARV